MTDLYPAADNSSPRPTTSRRGKTGCITCRLRKKRCDEGKPTCETCHRLGIECMGYGVKRPAWMRVDENRKRARKEIKQTIQSQTRRNSALDSVISDEVVGIPPEEKQSSASSSPSTTRAGGPKRSRADHTKTSAISENTLILDHPSPTRSDTRDLTGREDGVTTLQCGFNFGLPTPSLYGELDPTSIPVSSALDPHPASSVGDNWNDMFEISLSDLDLQAMINACTLPTINPHISFNIPPIASTWQEPNTFSNSDDKPSTTSITKSTQNAVPTSSSFQTPWACIPQPETHFLTLYSPLQLDPKSTATTHTGYLHHYLTVVLPLQYRLGSKVLSEFLGQLALTRPGVMTAATSLAALHLSSKRKFINENSAIMSFPIYPSKNGPSTNSTSQSLGDSDALIASSTNQQSLQKLQLVKDPELASEEIIVSTVFAASYHLFSGGTISGWGYLISLNQKCLGVALSNSPEVVGGPTLYTNPSPWKRFRPLIAVMIWMDIIGSVTRNIGSKLLPTYRALFSAPQDTMRNPHHRELKMDKVMGCDNLTRDIERDLTIQLLAYAEITHLAEWRSQSESNGSLSYSELVRRSSRIEKLFTERSEISRGENNWNSKKSFSLYQDETHTAEKAFPAEGRDRSTIQAMKEVFHSGAKVYLASVVNGPYPKVPEIAQAVQDVMDALEQLDITTCNAEINRALVLPITLTGCLADTPTQQTFFRNRFLMLGPEAACFGNSKEALLLMEEVWRQRPLVDVGKGVCWRKVMRDMGWDEGIFLI